MAKKIDKLIKIQVPAGQAKPSPPIGPVLGQAGVNIMMFVKEFNATTASMEAGTVLPVVITVYSDRSFTFILKTPPAAVLLKKVAKITSGSAEPNKKKVGKITREQLRAVAETKMSDLNCYDLDAASRIIEGTARSMGLEIEG